MAKVTEAKLTDFLPDPDNANLGTQRGQAMLEDSIREDGAARSIVVDADGVIVAGNKTHQGAVDAGLEKAVVVEVEGDELVIVKRTDFDLNGDDGRARRYAYRDNRSGQVSLVWDAEQLFADMGAGVDLSGLFTDLELGDILGDALEVETGEAPEAQLDRASELQEKWQVERGQIWEISSKTVEGKAHRLMCGDTNEDTDELFNGQKPSLLLTDPPYGISIVGGLRATDGGSKPVTIGSVRGRRPYPFGGVKNVRGTVGAANMVDATPYRPVHGDDEPFDPTPLLSIADNAIIWGGNYFASKLPDSRCWIVWDKENTGHFADAELAWTSFDRPTKLYRFKWSGLVREGKRDIEGVHRVHPTQKAVGLFVNILGDFSEVDALVTDLYLGSGTTLLACELCGQISLCMEIEPAYVAVTLDRAERMGLEPKLLP